MSPLLTNDLTVLGPEIFLALSALTLVLLGAFCGDRAARLLGVLAILALFVSALELVSEALLWPRTAAFNNLVTTDLFAVTLKALCLVGAAFALMISFSPLRREQIERFEYPVLVLLACLGMMLMLSAQNFLVLYMGIELSALSLYVLAAFRRASVASAEAGMKYFILGALSSGMLLFGISLLYGFSGSLYFGGVAAAATTAGGPPAGLVVGMVFVLAALAFKISAVPFHMWTPDVYHGAPTPVTAFFAMVPKMAAMGMVIRFLLEPFAGLREQWLPIVIFLAVASMIWGAVAAIAQTNVKRLLAYASIANMGYALLGVVAGTSAGLAATVLYIAIYLMMSAGVFSVLLSLRRDGQQVEEIRDLAGLSRTHPIMAYTLAVMMFAMAGIPPLAGFFGKLAVFQALVAAGDYGLAILGVVASVIAAYYYLKIIRVMFFDKAEDMIEGRMDAGQELVALASILFVLVFILMPQTFYDLALQSVGVFNLPKP